MIRTLMIGVLTISSLMISHLIVTRLGSSTPGRQKVGASLFCNSTSFSNIDTDPTHLLKCVIPITRM
ncbi:hypothetical protein Vid5_gp84 [Pantoea phage vB_PagS_Vid5]|uniref:Uncharacterized protein n=1 Tax=Pantoea phage vB_PagS_Vid5 TaxID=2099652 RepID=A0A2P1CKV6_9CAUD|nr:hypothetical protein FDJ45_gp071 [Pantoea phage vB_PagS_Vid5]AVJ51839.1 hypothetical protein Vid5_gp84 [Pantoea phage vB_PagS_Vid5]